jgi:hypothetical protein
MTMPMTLPRGSPKWKGKCVHFGVRFAAARLGPFVKGLETTARSSVACVTHYLRRPRSQRNRSLPDSAWLCAICDW